MAQQDKIDGLAAELAEAQQEAEAAAEQQALAQSRAAVVEKAYAAAMEVGGGVGMGVGVWDSSREAVLHTLLDLGHRIPVAGWGTQPHASLLLLLRRAHPASSCIAHQDTNLPLPWAPLRCPPVGEPSPAGQAARAAGRAGQRSEGGAGGGGPAGTADGPAGARPQMGGRCNARRRSAGQGCWCCLHVACPADAPGPTAALPMAMAPCNGTSANRPQCVCIACPARPQAELRQALDAAAAAEEQLLLAESRTMVVEKAYAAAVEVRGAREKCARAEIQIEFGCGSIAGAVLAWRFLLLRSICRQGCPLPTHQPTHPPPVLCLLPCPQEARALEGKQRQLEAALKRAQREGRALGGQQERVAALGVQLAEAQVRTALHAWCCWHAQCCASAASVQPGAAARRKGCGGGHQGRNVLVSPATRNPREQHH